MAESTAIESRRRVGPLGLVTSVRATGRGLIILAGPSSCGKGAIATVLRRTLRLPPENHVSMGDVLRATLARARADAAFRDELRVNCGISDESAIYDPAHNAESVVRKARELENELTMRYGERPTQLDWLEYCVEAGLLIPDRWSEKLIEGTVNERSRSPEAVIMLDGYPRTEEAARHVISMSERFDIPIIKVIHLSVSKREMLRRALVRGRIDDSDAMLERRYQFYVEQVQPAVELLKSECGSQTASLIDAHQPAYTTHGELDLDASVRNVARSVLLSLGVTRVILDTLTDL